MTEEQIIIEIEHMLHTYAVSKQFTNWDDLKNHSTIDEYDLHVREVVQRNDEKLKHYIKVSVATV
jgi:hypothetical protein